MAHPSTNSHSSSAFTPADDQQLDTTSNVIEENKNVGVNSKDWFYGTEELLDALPRVWTRSLLYLLIGFSAIALPWAMLSQVDETGTARGRIEPLGATQRLDSQITASITAVRVKEGDQVRAGQLLVELQSDVLQTDFKQAQAKLEGLINRHSQLELIKNQLILAIHVQEQQNQSQELEKIAQVNQAKQNLDAKQSTYNLQKLEKLALVDQAQLQINSTHNDHKSAESRLSIDSKQVERFRKLVKDGAVSANQVDQLRKEEQESKRLNHKTQSDIKQAQLRLQEEQNRYQATMRQAQVDIQLAKLRVQEGQSSYQSVIQAGKLAVLKNQEQLKDMHTQIVSLKSEIAQTKNQIASLKLQLEQRVVRSPIDGIIFDLPIKKAGVVVQPGQIIAQIAPKQTPFVIKANMPSQQSGFLKLGMPVKIKFDAYPFQDYGVVPGRVIRISPDSKIQETSQGKIENFELEISLNQPDIQSGNKHIPLTPGQTATAEVIVRQRRVIDFILDPFKKLQKGGLDL